MAHIPCYFLLNVVVTCVVRFYCVLWASNLLFSFECCSSSCCSSSWRPVLLACYFLLNVVLGTDISIVSLLGLGSCYFLLNVVSRKISRKMSNIRGALAIFFWMLFSSLNISTISSGSSVNLAIFFWMLFFDPRHPPFRYYDLVILLFSFECCNTPPPRRQERAKRNLLFSFECCSSFSSSSPPWPQLWQWLAIFFWMLFSFQTISWRPPGKTCYFLLNVVHASA